MLSFVVVTSSHKLQHRFGSEIYTYPNIMSQAAVEEPIMNPGLLTLVTFT